MSKGWGLCLVGLLGVTFSFAYGQERYSLARDAQWEQARRLLAEGNAKQAKESFEALLKRYPKEPDLYLFLALSSLRLREVEAAERNCREALALAPDHAEARTLLGWIDLEVRGDYAAAVDEYAKVVRLRPDSAEAYNNLGAALRKKGDMEKALRSFDRALELRPDYGEARSNRGWIYVEQKKWREARSDFEAALKIDPRDAGALYGLTQVLREAHDYAGAQKALRSLIAESPNFVYWLEWGELGLVRYYWVLLLIAVGFFAQAQVHRLRSGSHGG